MGTLTTDNVDDLVRNALRFYFDDITKRLEELQILIRQDIGLDSKDTQKGDSSGDRITQIVQLLEYQRSEMDLLKKFTEDIGRKIYEMDEKLSNFLVRR